MDRGLHDTAGFGLAIDRISQLPELACRLILLEEGQLLLVEGSSPLPEYSI